MDGVSPTSTAPELRVRVDVIDHVMVEPGPLDDPGDAQGIPARRVPVIRIFGDSSMGHKTCVHVHQVWSYFYVEYPGPLEPDSVNGYISRLHFSLNTALAMSMGRNHERAIGQFVRSIVLVKGIPFYGFHAGYEPFLKVMLTTPDQANRAIMILQSGSVMNRKMNVFESHLSYPLQFMCDFNLYGCGWIDLKSVSYRRRVDEDEDVTFEHLYQPVTTLPVEVDVLPHNILNRYSLEPRYIHHELRIPASPPPLEPLVPSVRELWEDEQKRRESKGLNPTPELPFFDPVCRQPWADWAAEERFRGPIEQRIDRERSIEVNPKNKNWESWVMTTFESVEALWKREHRTWRVLGEITKPGEMNPFVPSGSVQDAKVDEDVDERLLSSQNLDERIMEEWDRWDEPVEDGDVDEQEAETKPQGRSERPLNLPHLSAERIGNGLTLQRAEDFEESRTERLSPQGILNTDIALDEGENAPTTKSRVLDAHAQDVETLSLKRSLSIPELGIPAAPQGSNGMSNSQPVEIEDVFFTPKPKEEKSSQNWNSDSPPEREKFMKGSTPRDMLSFFGHSSPNSSISLSAKPRISTTKSGQSSFGFEYVLPPPSKEEIASTLETLGIPYMVYKDPYYSNLEDVPEQGWEFGGLYFELQGGDGYGPREEWHENGVVDEVAQDHPEVVNASLSAQIFKEVMDVKDVPGWEFSGIPPSRRQVIKWVADLRDRESSQKRKRKKSQIEIPTAQESFVPHDKQLGVKRSQEFPSMSVLSLEVFCATVNAGYDPENDELAAICWCFSDGYPIEDKDDRRAHYRSGILVVNSTQVDIRRLRSQQIEVCSTELDMINFAVDTVRELDPDIITGWEIQSLSWGYFIARAQSFGVDARDLLGRAPSKAPNTFMDSWSTNHTSKVRIAGRHALNAWRLMRSELTLNFYSFHNVVRHVLRQRTPKYSNRTLKDWFIAGSPAQTSRVLEYFAEIACIVLEVLDATQVITKTAEFARVFGIDFFSVLSRGSQFKVESFMLRIAKPESFVLVSPSRAQVGKQNAAECMPLIMEPVSAFYKGPLLVLDFQSLYPSVMVAYNYCYSTCLGRIKELKGKNKFGVYDHLEIQPGLLEKVQDHINVAPNGMIYVKPSVRKSLLAKMLTELLNTRVMVKEGMKLNKGDKPLLRVLDARQLGLKSICNVTYGYTSATFSGRMPAVEVADSIVQTGRETLEHAIDLIETTTRWGAKVVYGDTDSLFVYLPGKTKEQAFVIGNQIAHSVTAANPSPVTLKFEKVYLPCVLLAKKRYVGFKYESVDQEEPIFDAKGIETVRRDGIPAGQKMLESAIKLLFRTQDLSQVKSFCWRTWTKILEGRASIQDFIFAQEVRLGTYSERGGPPPGAAVALARLANDPNDETQYGERIRYVVTRAAPGDQLRHRAVAPEVLLFDESGRQLDTMYYVTRRLIPPLARIFNLVGADVQNWFDEMPKSQKIENYSTEGRRYALSVTPQRPGSKIGGKNQKIDIVLASGACITCEGPTMDAICEECHDSPDATTFTLMSRLQFAEKKVRECQLVCAHCSGSSPEEPIHCESTECEWLYERVKANRDAMRWKDVPRLVKGFSSISSSSF